MWRRVIATRALAVAVLCVWGAARGSEVLMPPGATVYNGEHRG
jgi:hypothetical protein